jgi:uncharacterized membrane protein
MSKLLSVVYMFFCLGLAFALDEIFGVLQTQFTRSLKPMPIIVGGTLLNVIFVAALLLLIWLVLFRQEKSLFLSIIFLMTGIVMVFLVPIVFANARALFHGLPGSMYRSVSNVLNVIGIAKSYFLITATFILGIGGVNLFRRN